MLHKWTWARNEEDIVLKRDDGNAVQVWRIVPAISDEEADFVTDACNAHEAIKKYPGSGIPYAKKIS